MACTETPSVDRASNRLLGAVLRGMVAGFGAWRQVLATRRAVANLTPDQLRDIGYPEAPRATLEIQAGLITNLISMR